MKSHKSNELESLAGDHDVTFASGDYVKFEIKNDGYGRIRVDVAQSGSLRRPKQTRVRMAR